ncbi:DUF6545 domain-containing protein [Cellulomonas cellasea]|uniref:DUF6545 domain-containing protein n=1 Tax=Cellulomonas cellasea TaxID=43670 RepID=UPI00114192E4|nr:DUF6545 domain-containing protein [Cellulomonas cellasea]
MDELVTAGVVVLWAVTVVEVVRALRGTGTRSLLVAVAALAAGRTLDLDAVGEALGRTTALAAVEHVLVVVSAVAVVAFTHRITGEHRTVPRPVWVVLALALAAPLVDAGGALPATAEDRAAAYASSVPWLVHWVAFLVTLAVALTAGARIALRNGRLARGVLGVRLIGLGAGQVLGVLYTVLKALHLGALVVSPGSEVGLLGTAEQAALSSAILLVAVGLVVGFAATVAADLATRRRLWVLWPVWADLWPHAPHLDHTPPGRLRTTFSPDARIREVRLVVEIGDALRVLSPYVPAHDHTDPVAQAAALQLASRRVGQDVPASPPSGPRPAETGFAARTRELYALALAWPRAAAVRAQIVPGAGADGDVAVPAQTRASGDGRPGAGESAP